MHPPAPCLRDPAHWDIPDGVTDPYAWASTPTARDAIHTCRTCPLLTSCAQLALAAGTTQGATKMRPADGMIMAGVVCTGDERTRHSLAAVLGTPSIRPGRTASRVGRPCDGPCGRILATEPDGPTQAREKSRGLCSRCWNAADRAGLIVSARPTHCQGACGRPLTTRTRRQAGHVVHEGNGLCRMCWTADRRARTADPVAA